MSSASIGKERKCHIISSNTGKLQSGDSLLVHQEGCKDRASAVYMEARWYLSIQGRFSCDSRGGANEGGNFICTRKGEKGEAGSNDEVKTFSGTSRCQ